MEKVVINSNKIINEYTIDEISRITFDQAIKILEYHRIEVEIRKEILIYIDELRLENKETIESYVSIIESRIHFGRKE